MNGNKSLLQIGEERLKIENYVITKDPVIVTTKYQDTGDIIILTDHDGSEVVPSELKNKGYTDLYVGDEHIAGGYGFESIQKRNDVLARIDKVDSLEDRIDKLENSPSDSSENTQRDLSWNNNKIKIDGTQFEFEIDNTLNELNIKTTKKASISDCYLIDSENNIVKDNSVYEIGKFPNLKSLSFEYEGDEEIKGYYISYKKEKDMFLTDIFGSYINYTDRTYFVVENQYALEDPDLDPSLKQQRFLLHFTSSAKPEFEKICREYAELNLYLTVVLNSHKITKRISTLIFTAPCFWIENSLEHMGTITTDNYSKYFFVKPGGEEKLVVFEHGTDQTWGSLLIPQNLCEDLDCLCVILNDTNVRYKWQNAENNTLELITQIGTKEVYSIYNTPNPYKGTVKWRISILNKENI